nr:retrovirus-related Pol polyprotein from transposon TNT 1-94 [Tanacetum cinerariifolium]
MTRVKFDIEKFDGTSDLKLWRIRMRVLLIQHGCEAALEVLPVDMEAQTKVELNKKAHSIVILYLGNNVLREVTGETTTAGVWSKLENLYMTKSLANKLYLKKNLYTFHMPAGRKISEHIDEFNKIVLDLANIERNCPKNNHNKSTGYVKIDEQPSSNGSTYDDSDVMMVMSAQALLDWIMDSGCSYHMTPRYIPELKRNFILQGTLEKEGFTVILQWGKVKVINGFRVVLSGIRKDNCVYSLDGHAMADELNASVE